MLSVSAQDPTLELGTCADYRRYSAVVDESGYFYVAGGLWTKYSFEHLSGTFEELWECRECNYEVGNAKAK